MSLQTTEQDNIGRDNTELPKAKNVNFVIIYFDAFMERQRNFL